MMDATAKNTTALEVIESFESSFSDKHVIPFELEMVWLQKAIGIYSLEIDPLNFDSETLEFDCALERYIIDHLAMMMHQYYQERELSKVNKRMSIVGKDLSINGGQISSKYTEDELNIIREEVNKMSHFQKPSAYN